MVSLQPSDIHCANIVLKPLSHDINRNALETILQLVRTSFGPQAKLKLLRNVVGGHVSITSSSSRLFHLASIKNIFLRFIIASVNSHLSVNRNGGLFCTLFILLILKHSLNLEIKNTLVADLNKYFIKIFIEFLQSNENKVVFEVEWSNINHLHDIIYTIISSKPGCFFSEKNKEDITLLLLKAFVNTFPSEDNKNVGKIYFHSEEGLDPSESKLVNGILLRCPLVHFNFDFLITKNEKLLKVALFSTSLAGDADFPSAIETDTTVWNSVLLYLERIVDKLINDRVDIVLCQKVIHPAIKKKLWDSHILTLDRLGSETTLNIENCSGAFPVICLSEAFDIKYGSFTLIKKIEIDKKSFLLCQNEIKPTWTVILCNSNEESLSEMKVVCKQAIDALYHLLKKPQVCSGAGCTEIYASHFLQKKVMEQATELALEFGCTSAQILKVLQNFIFCIQETVLSLYQGPKFSFVTETIYGHLWEQNEITCKCGKYTSDKVDSTYWRSFQMKGLDFSIPSIIDYDRLFEISSLEKNVPKIIDELSVKTNALSLSVEVSSSLLNVGLLIMPYKY